MLTLAAASWVNAQGLAPDDPSISGGLQVWLKDPLNNYNPATGVWIDSSGKGNNAEVFDDAGTANPVQATTTFSAPAAGAFTPQVGGFFEGIGEVPGLDISGTPAPGTNAVDLLAVLDLNPSPGNAGVSVGTLITVYQSDAPNNATRALGFGSRAEVAGNGENDFQLTMDGSLRYNNGFSGGSQVHGAGLKFRASRLENGVAFDILDGVDNIGPSSVTSGENGVPNPTSSDNLFIGNLQGGGANDDFRTGGGQPGLFGSDFFIATVIYYDTALSALDMNNIGVWLQSNLVEAVSVTGDYNGDEVVNAADYTVWRDSLNSTGPGLPADGDGDMDVDADDYLVWRNAFLGAGSGGGDDDDDDDDGGGGGIFPGPVSIPEPCSLTLVLGLSLSLMTKRAGKR